MTTTALYSQQMKGCLSYPLTPAEIPSSKAGPNPMKPLFSDVGDI